MMLLEYLLDSFEGVVQLRLGMRCHEGEADQRILRSDGRRYDRVDEYPGIK